MCFKELQGNKIGFDVFFLFLKKPVVLMRFHQPQRKYNLENFVFASRVTFTLQ
jgi:hypothetical protein